MGGKGFFSKSRDYIHDRCRSRTRAGGWKLVVLANPLTISFVTKCQKCEKLVPIWDVAWADTGENITAYRKRLRARVSIEQKAVAWLLGPAIAWILGLVALWFMVEEGGAKIIAGGMAGVVFYLMVILPVLAPLLFRVDYRTFE